MSARPRRRALLLFAFVLNAVAFFAAGVALRDTAQDWRDQDKAKLVRECPYYVVMTRRGFECKRLMIFFEIGNPMTDVDRRARPQGDIPRWNSTEGEKK